MMEVVVTEVFEKKVVKIRRESLEVDDKGKFSLIGPNGMPWFGDCRVQDHGPDEYYAVIGVVTTGPAEWVGLPIKISGEFHGETLDLEPAELSVKTETLAEMQAAASEAPE